jgi:hypothetical protein
MIKAFARTGMPMGDLGFTANNGNIGRCPQNNYFTVNGNSAVAITRSLVTDPAVLTVPITNYGAGSVCWQGMTWTVTANTGNGTGVITLNGVAINANTRYCLAPGATMNIVITYQGADGQYRGNLTFGNIDALENTRVPFDISTIRMDMNSLG